MHLQVTCRARGLASVLVALPLIASGCTLELTFNPSPRATSSPTASPSPSSIALAEHCPGTDRTLGKPAGPAIDERSENWAGYVAYDTTAEVSCVEGSWVQPAITCALGGREDVAIWVGIDGVTSRTAGIDAAGSLVQIGTQAGCDAGQPGGFAWYQVLPEDPLSVRITTVTIAPGDRIRAMVGFADGAFTLQLADLTSGGTFSIVRSVSDAPRQTAEWIVEAPMIGCPDDCAIAPLPRFPQVTFSDAYMSTGAQRGAIDDDNWANGTTEMVRDGTVRASVSGLSVDGTSFNVTWRHR